MHDTSDGGAVGSDRALLAGSRATHAAPLRGRDGALADVLGMLASVRDGAGGPILVRGMPGIGKTRLLAEVLSRAAATGWRTLVIAPDIDESTVPLAALIEAALRGPSPLLSTADLDPVLAGGEPQYWVTRLLLDRLEQTAAEHPLLIVIDDLQWLDTASVTALLALVRGLADQPVAWLVATRDGALRPAHARAVTQIAAEGLVIDLAPLAPVASAEIAADIAGGAPGPVLRGALDQTANVPLLVVELVRGLREEHLLARRAGSVDTVDAVVPARFGAAARERLASISPAARRFAQVASLFGRRFRLRDVLRALEMSAAIAAPSVDELLAESILVEDDGDLAFAHDTLREAADASISSSLRPALLREVVRVRLSSGESASAVAPAVLEAAEPGDEDSFVLVAEAAREISATDSAFAADLAAAAIRLAVHVPRLVVRAAELLPLVWTDGRHDEAQSVTTALAPYLSADLRARALLAVARRQTEFSFDRAIVTCDEALGIRGIARSTRAELLAVRALNCANRADFEGLEQTLALARVVADPATDHLALATIDATDSVYQFNSGHHDRAVELIDAALARAQDAGLVTSRWLPEGLWPAFLHNSMGDPDHALELADTGLSEARAAGSAVAEAFWMMVRTRVLYDRGRIDEARVLAEAVLSLSAELGLGDFANATAGGVLFRIALHTGDAQIRAQAKPIVEALAASTSVTKAGRWLLAVEAIDEGRLDDAVAASDLARAALDTPVPPMTTPSDFSDDIVLADLAVRTSDAETVAAVRKRTSRRCALNPASVFARAVHDAVIGRTNGDPSALEASASALRGLSRPLVLARVLELCHVVGDDPQRARRSLEEALEVYESLGAVRDASRVLRALRTRGVRRRPARRGTPELLSTRERQVAERVAAGATTQQIADALFMSPHTVVSHIRHLYAKTGVNSRSALRLWYANMAHERDTAQEQESA
jgi:DNA-binding CsgD family transcriptional regulator